MEAMRSASDNITRGLYETPPNSGNSSGRPQLQRSLRRKPGKVLHTILPMTISKTVMSAMYYGGGLNYQASGADIGLQMPSMTRTETVGGNSGSTVDSPVTVPETQSGMVTPPPLSIPSSPPALFRKAVQDT